MARLAPSSATDTLAKAKMRNDTIVAIATPAGVGGIAVVRVSGSDALSMALSHLSVGNLEPRHATYCRFDDIDDGIAVYFPAGYTGEPTVEFSCHGSIYVQQAIVQTFVDSGARMAEPGEYTMRAFLNGRLDLSQAEAVADLIDAATPAQHRLAVSQLRGGYAEELKALRQQLLDLTSLLELELDFSQEDVEFADRSQLQGLLRRLSEAVTKLIASFRMGNAIKHGIPLAIVGAPNAGKSTLLNALLNDERAIVSPIPGTTRDTIEETLVIEGIPFRLIDTAGIHQSTDTVEWLGIERSRKAMKEAEVVLCVCDSTAKDDETEWILEELKNRKCLLVVNKADLMDNPRFGNIEPGSACYWISALTGEGIDELKHGIAELAGVNMDASSILLSNARHVEALRNVAAALRQVEKGLADGIPADLVAVDLRDALYHLGTITGDVTSDEILGNIFSRFCVGK